jgi:hypothetical protein
MPSPVNATHLQIRRLAEARCRASAAQTVIMR